MEAPRRTRARARALGAPPRSRPWPREDASPRTPTPGTPAAAARSEAATSPPDHTRRTRRAFPRGRSSPRRSGQRAAQTTQPCASEARVCEEGAVRAGGDGGARTIAIVSRKCQQWARCSDNAARRVGRGGGSIFRQPASVSQSPQPLRPRRRAAHGRAPAEPHAPTHQMRPKRFRYASTGSCAHAARSGALTA